MFFVLSAIVALVHALLIVAVFTGIFVSIKVRWFRPVEALVLIMAVVMWSFFAGCPLTTLQNYLRAKAGLLPLDGGFITHYLAYFLGLHVSDQTISVVGYLIALGFLVLAVDWMYNGHVWSRRLSIGRRLKQAI